MNKQELAAKIWKGATELRGKVSASSYKDYMLGFIFYKYISEKEEKYLKEQLYFEDADLSTFDENDTGTLNHCKDRIGYFIPGKSLFSSWIKNIRDFTIADVRTSLSSFNRNIGKNYKKVFTGVFNSLETGLDSFGTTDSERSKGIKKLIELINQIPTDGKQEYDVLGFVYEFLLKNFAANAGKAGEFYTPNEASLIMSEIISYHLKDREEISVYDPTSGSGSLLINIGKSVAKQMGHANKIKYYAQELISETYNLTRMNLVMRDIIPDNIVVRNGDTLKDDWPFFDENNAYDPVFVDACCSNPPYSQTWANEDAGTDVRFKDYGTAPKSKADYAFLLHNLYHLRSDGIMTIVMPHGVLFRGGEEGEIRKKLVEKDNIETIIGLPANTFFGTGIPTIIIVLKKQRDTDGILFIDASKGFVKDGNKNRLRAKDVRKIIDTVINRAEIPNFSRIVSKSEVMDENECNLNIPRYVDSSDKAEQWDIYATMFGGIPNAEIDELEEYWQLFPSLKKELFENTDIPYSNVLASNIKDTIANNEDVKNFISNYKNSLSELPVVLKQHLIDNYNNISIIKEENILASFIKNALQNVQLIDYYDAYQVLDDHWMQISIDLENLQTEGLSALNAVDPNMVIKKDSKTKELIEKQEGWVGRVLPFELIQTIFFKTELDTLNELNTSLSDYTNIKEELLESIDPGDKTELVDDNGEIVTKKLNAVIAKIKKQLKSGAEFDEDSYENIMMKISSANENIKKVKKSIKDLSTKIEAETKTKIENLTEEEAKSLLEEKWIKSLVNEINNLSTIMLNDFATKVIHLSEKYLTSYNDLALQIKDTENVLSSIIDDIDGNEFDTLGLQEFKKLLGGE